MVGPPTEDYTGHDADVGTSIEDASSTDDVDAFIYEVTGPVVGPERRPGEAYIEDAEPGRTGEEAGHEPAGREVGPSPRPTWTADVPRQSALSRSAWTDTAHLQRVANVATPTLVTGDDSLRAATRTIDTDWRRDGVQPVAESGWRRWVYFASGKTLNLGENPSDVSARELDRQLQTPIEDEFSLGIVQLKGGAAKTTTAIGLGNAFAEVRTDAVIAVDVNPDRGNLARRTRSRTDSSVFTLLGARRPNRVQEVRAHTNETPAGLEILASAQDPATTQAFSADDYHAVIDIVKDFYSLIVSDCGTNITHQATQAVLRRADALVIPLDAKNDSAEEAVAAIEYLHSAYAKDPETNQAITDDQGNTQWLYRHLLARTIVVVSHQRPGKRMFDVDKSLAWFKERVMDVHVIPYDPHLEESSEIVPERLDPATRLAYRELAAKVARLFPITYSTGSLRRAG
ncbi:hypothetical protein OPAG_08346 [Rhodococcus opacus PD630]|nr:ESX-1 secretion-associated protein EspI [Rhodococcus opacus PD630]EHI39115.1 hypothetical protein OPAG_08346 [Rhodococcus opacus PD630]UDH01785.1 MinD/ParA family protein [Rhodococcus opacus PD630]